MRYSRYTKYVIISIITLLLLLGVAFSLFKLSKARSFQLFGGLTSRVETDQKVVALTFDDAPTDHATEVLKILQDENIKATFYAIGQNLEKYPQESKAIIESGMELGNHTYSHQRMLLKSQRFIDQEISKTSSLIRSSGYTGEITFRPPNGKKLFGLPWYLKRHGIQTIMWDVEPDTYYRDSKDIVRYTVEQTKPGSIILLHPFCDSCTADREALPAIIDSLKKEGYSFVTVSQLLTYKN